MKQSFHIGGRAVGDGAPCFLIAEAGSNHNGELANALRLIEVAAEAGASAIKFQTFEAKKLYPKTAGTSDYLGDPTPIFDIIAAMEMPRDWLPTLAARARALGLAFISSPFHEAAVALLDPFVDAFKIASYELTHAPLLEEVARRGKPVILSTGASTLPEIDEAVATLTRVGCTELILLQCTASYPTPPAAVNARALQTLRDRYHLPTGLSDHSRDPVIAPVVAVTLGAAAIEKHFTLSNAMPGPDHAFAVEPDELARLVASVRQAEQVVGTGDKTVHAVEGELRQFARRSIFATAAISAGAAFTEDNVAVLRHGKHASGLPPEAWARVLGTRAARAIGAETALVEADLEDGVTLRRVVARDRERLFTWANDPEARAVSIHRAPIAWDTHVAWFERSLASATRHLWIAVERGVEVGVLRLDREDGGAVVSITIDAAARGRGLGHRVLGLADREAAGLGIARLVAFIRADNAASLRVFQHAGYRDVGGEDRDGMTVRRFERA